MQDLLVETGRVKDLYTQCHDRGIHIGDFGTAVRTTREFISNRRFLLALDRMRELKLELLAELILSDQLPPEDLVTAPGVIENALPSEALAADIESRIVTGPLGPEPRAPKPPMRA